MDDTKTLHSKASFSPVMKTLYIPSIMGGKKESGKKERVGRRGWEEGEGLVSPPHPSCVNAIRMAV